MTTPHSAPLAHRIAVCLYVRNAENDIQEWIAYHLLIGVRSFLIYDNGSDDSTVKMAMALSPIVDVRIVPWAHATGVKAQGEAYLDCLERFRGEFDWLLYVDSDEFLASADGEPLQALLTRYSHSTAIVFNWACFGSSGHISAPAGLIIENFCRRGPDNFGPNAHTKMIVRPDAVVDYVNPHFFATTGSVERATGGPISWRIPGITDIIDISSWRVNHYFLRSRAQWIAKLRRGYRDITRSEAEFEYYDRNDIEDRTAEVRATDVRQFLKDALRPP